MGKFFRFAVFIFLSLLFFWPVAFSAFSQTPTPTPTITPTPTPTPTPTLTPTSTPEPGPNLEEIEKRVAEIQQEEAKIQQELARLVKEKRTLTSQLSILDNQIKLTTLKIEQTQRELDKLEEEIRQLTQTLSKLRVDLAKIEQLLTERIRATYKKGNLSAIELFISSQSFSDFFNRFKYLQVIQAADRRTLYQTQQAKAIYTNQKEAAEKKEQEVTVLKIKLDSQNQSLKIQKGDKERLLAITKNDEKRFQGMLLQLQAELESITRALGNVGVKIGSVEKGSQIAAVGNNGCSTGPHLHFEVFENAKVEQGRVQGNRVDPKPYLDSGRLDKPLSSYNGQEWPDGNITTRYGEVYFLGVHTGLDMADDLGTPIYAADKGIAYFVTDTKACYLTKTVGRGIVIDHQNGLVTLYWHVL
jgi:peptidoglycan hydrolase CwlO-like protein